MPEPSSFRYSQPLQVNLENIPQTKQSSDSQGYPPMYTQMTDESQDALLPRYAYDQQKFSQPVQCIAQPRSTYISQIDRDRPVRDYFRLSIFATLCCCLPIGIWAIIQSLKTRKLADQGRYADAQKSSRCTLSLIIASIILGIILTIVVIVFRVTQLKEEHNDP